MLSGGDSSLPYCLVEVLLSGVEDEWAPGIPTMEDLPGRLRTLMLSSSLRSQTHESQCQSRKSF
jgi:hypothetical protein